MLGRNLQLLREFYGETQAGLAERMGISEACISRWETGDRPNIKHEYIEWFAKYYGVTLEDLVHGDLSCLKNQKFNFDFNEFCKLNMVFYPIAKSDEAMKDCDFSKGYRKTITIFKKLSNREELSIEFFEETLADYEVAIEKKQCKEAIVNIISLILMMGVEIIYGNDDEISEALNREKTIGPDLLKKAYLKDWSRNACVLKERECLRKDFIKETKDILSYIKILKKDSSWSDIGDFFIALRYMLGIASVSCDEQISHEIGYEMMNTYAKLGNRYAKKLLSTVNKSNIIC